MKILVIGYQSASINNLFECLKYFKFKKIKFEILNNSSVDNNLYKSLCKKKVDINKLNNLYLDKKYIISGTSETFYEKNLWNYFYKNKIQYSVYVDSVTNLKKRFIHVNNFPQTILIPNINVKNTIKKTFPVKSINTKFIVIGFIYLEYLYFLDLKNLINKINKQNYNAYFTSNLNFNFEFSTILKVNKYSEMNNKKLIIFIHPRSNLQFWKKKLSYYMNIEVKNKKFLNYKNKINFFFGISTMALLNCLILQKEVYYLNYYKNKNTLTALFDFFGVGKFKLNKESLLLLNKPKLKNINSVIGSMEIVKSFLNNIVSFNK